LRLASIAPLLRLSSYNCAYVLVARIDIDATLEI
jgi:hypothetical protein